MISGGTDTGVMKMVGEANKGTENVSIGVVTWGVLAHSEALLPKDPTPPTEQEKTEKPIEHPYPKEGSYLNLEKNKCYVDENHTHFLFVDDPGKEGNWGAEIDFRNR